jgi:hypothetical protein
MARSTASRITGAPPEKQERPAAEAAPPTPVSDPQAAPKTGWRWRLTVFLFLTSFGFLFAYELLSAVLRMLKRGGGG